MKVRNKKNNLKDDLTNLENKLKKVSGYDIDVDSLYDEYSQSKKEYTEVKKKRRKLKGIRNLKVSFDAVVLALPIVLTIGATVGMGAWAYNDNCPKQEECKIVSMDSNGGYATELTNKNYNDCIEIETNWLEEGNNITKYTYAAHKDFKDESEMKEILNYDALELMQKYDFEMVDKETLEKTKERENFNKGQEIITVNAGVLGTKAEQKKARKPNTETIVLTTLVSAVGLVIFGGISWLLIDVFTLNLNLKYDIKDFNSSLKNLDYEEKKNKYKQLKKKIK